MADKSHKIDEEKIKEAVRLFMEGIGEDPGREGLIETPNRIARMSHELFAGMEQDPATHLCKTFPTKSRGIVVEKNIRFYSICEHHMLPFYGYVHIAYVPDGKVTGLSKLVRCVDTYARRLQIQENMTWEIMEAVDRTLNPKGVMVMVEADHMCIRMRGIKNDPSRTVTTALCGCFEDNENLQNTFYQAVRLADGS